MRENVTPEVRQKHTLSSIKDVVDHAIECISRVDQHGHYLSVNQFYATSFGYEQDDMVGMSWLDYLRPEEMAKGRTAFKDMLKNGRAELEIGGIKKSGKSFVMHMLLVKGLSEDDVIGGHYFFMRDITEKKLAEQRAYEQQLQETRQKFRKLYDETPAIFYSLDHENTIISINQFGAAALGYECEELIGQPLSRIIYPDDITLANEKITRCFEKADSMLSWEIRKLHRDGHYIWTRDTAHNVLTDKQTELYIVSEDISEIHALSEQLQYQASHDSLTNLVNRGEFERRLQHLIDESKMSIPGHAICYIDLDNFKIINDTCGHIAGDTMLKQLSELLSTRVRTRDTLARLGGDEFGILMEHCSLNQAKRVAEKILTVVNAYRFEWDDNKFAITASIGLVPINDMGGSVNDILSAADNACYVAKDSGRNRIHIFTPNDDELEKRRGEMQWVARINQAIEEDRLCLFYQDIIPVKEPADKNKRHFELLLRIKSADGDYILPGAFLPAAERYNLSVNIDQWVIDTALAWLISEPRIIDTVARCSINISGVSLSNEYFLKSYVEKIGQSHIPAEKLCFEITETAAISNLTHARTFINQMRQMGCSFALDDFGSGLSSFAYLKNLPVDLIKIDGAFIQDLTVDLFDYEMVSAINRLGHAMEKKTIAEFVENNQILHMLDEIGVEYAQGYGISKPKPLEEFLLN